MYKVVNMRFVQLKTVRDLVMLVASSPTTNVIQHLENNGHIYFVIGGTLSEVFIYLVKQSESLEGKFINYNSYTDVISFSDKMATEPNMSSFPIIDIKEQDMIVPGTLEKLSRL